MRSKVKIPILIKYLVLCSVALIIAFIGIIIPKE